MELRTATEADGDAIRRIARDSMEQSYSLSPRTIEGAIKQWYDDEQFVSKLDEADTLLLVTEENGELNGFAESDLVAEGGNGDLLWLHVAPDHRGTGIGEALFEQTHETLFEMGATQLRAKVLEDNAEGNDFYATFGFEQVDTDEVEIDGDLYTENIYMETDAAESVAGDAPSTTVPETATTADGREMYVNEEHIERGSKGPFFTTYTDPEFDENDKYGYFCANCEALDNAMDSMGRVKCNECGNLRKATRWDATAG